MIFLLAFHNHVRDRRKDKSDREVRAVMWTRDCMAGNSTMYTIPGRAFLGMFIQYTSY